MRVRWQSRGEEATSEREDTKPGTPLQNLRRQVRANNALLQTMQPRAQEFHSPTAGRAGAETAEARDGTLPGNFGGNTVSRTVAERKALGTARTVTRKGCNSYRVGAAHLPRACAPWHTGKRNPWRRNAPTSAARRVRPPSCHSGGGGGTAEWKRGNKDGSAARRLTREYPSRSAARLGLRTAAVSKTHKGEA